jgi:GNAT superfamily N-acetyltransferase
LNDDREGMLDHARNALELARKHTYRAIEVDALRLLADVHRTAASPAHGEAELAYREASGICLELGLRPEYARCQVGLGQTLMQSGRTEEAERLLDEAWQLCRNMGLVLTEAELRGAAAVS